MRAVGLVAIFASASVCGCAGPGSGLASAPITGPIEPGFYYAKPRVTETAYQQDVKLCSARGRQAVRDYGKRGQAVAAVAPVDYHGEKYGVGPGVGSSVAGNGASPGQQKTKARVYAEAHKACMHARGYGEVELTQLETEEFAALSRDERNEKFVRWATGQETTANSH